MIGYIVQWRVKKGVRGSIFSYLPRSDQNWSEVEPGKNGRKWLPPFRLIEGAMARMQYWKKETKLHGDFMEYRLWKRKWKE